MGIVEASLFYFSYYYSMGPHLVKKGSLNMIKYIGSGKPFYNEQNRQKLKHCYLWWKSIYLFKVRKPNSERRTLRVTNTNFEQAITAKHDYKKPINCWK